LRNSPKIIPNDSILFKSDTIIREFCTGEYLSQFELAHVNPPNNLLTPSINLNLPLSKISLGENTEISIKKSFYNGVRDYLVYNWSLVSSTDSNTSLLE
jgi:hypothetical protein